MPWVTSFFYSWFPCRISRSTCRVSDTINSQKLLRRVLPNFTKWFLLGRTGCLILLLLPSLTTRVIGATGKLNMVSEPKFQEVTGSNLAPSPHSKLSLRASLIHMHWGCMWRGEFVAHPYPHEVHQDYMWCGVLGRTGRLILLLLPSLTTRVIGATG